MNAWLINTWPFCTTNGVESVPLIPFTTAKRSALIRNWLCTTPAFDPMPKATPADTICPLEFTSIFTAHMVDASPSKSACALETS
ncbi:hypothetical protein D3C78_1547930 [compost metagenome]